ncbi:hypothetical protein ACZ91_40920 [Streptomyces regensis]|nr:hypothetical protein ACZ91_40920 [Streptomyces regensis]
MTTANTTSSSNAVVPPSTSMSTVDTRTIAMTLVNTIATHGLRRNGCTVPNTFGMMRSFAMP